MSGVPSGNFLHGVARVFYEPAGRGARNDEESELTAQCIDDEMLVRATERDGLRDPAAIGDIVI